MLPLCGLIATALHTLDRQCQQLRAFVRCLSSLRWYKYQKGAPGAHPIDPESLIWIVGSNCLTKYGAGPEGVGAVSGSTLLVFEPPRRTQGVHGDVIDGAYEGPKIASSAHRCAVLSHRKVRLGVF